MVVIGTSAGGLEALQTIFRGLPRNFDAAVLVVMHRTEHTASLLTEILARHSQLPVTSAVDGEPIRRQHIYVAPPGMHLLVESGRMRTVRGPRENRHRPAIDPLFRSAAATYGPRVIGVILTGMLDDGTSGLMVVRAHGGNAIVQDPRTAMFPAMPQNALNRVPESSVVNLERIPSVLQELLAEVIDPRGYGIPYEDSAAKESRIVDVDMAELEDENRIGQPSEFACPECGGVLWEIRQGNLLRFRCRVGHAYTADHLEAAQRHAVESALWAGLRALEENLSLYKKLSLRARTVNNLFIAQMYEDRIVSTETNTRVLQEFLLNVNGRGETEDVDSEESA